MKLFQCQCCGLVLHFENTACLNCGRAVGYLPDEDRMIAVDPDGPLWAAAPLDAGDTRRWRFCRNWEQSACNWLVSAGAEGTSDFCIACRHNRTVPDLSDPVAHSRWQRIEAAKRRLVYQILRLGLPHPAPGEGHAEPLVFDFLADDPGSGARVLTGHDNGVVTIALIEANDAAREQTRSEMGEAYRTLLGHFRHEVGHYYWDVLVRDGGALDRFRALFGDDRQDYAAALQQHYARGPEPGWQRHHVSAYAAMHPWEDWAESWAHYLHMVDTLDTAAAFGMTLDPGVDDEGDLAAEIDFDPYRSRRVRRLLSAWTPLTVALNALNRSMGQPDLYPFVLRTTARDKLGFVHEVVQKAREAPGNS